MQCRDVPVWLTDLGLQAELERLGQQALQRVRGRRPAIVDADEQRRSGVRAVNPENAGVYFIDSCGIPLEFVPDDEDELNRLAELLRGLPPGDQGRILRELADRKDPPTQAPNTTMRLLTGQVVKVTPRKAAELARAGLANPRSASTGGAPRSRDDRVAVREWFRHRVRVNKQLRADVLRQESRPSEDTLKHLGAERIVFKDEESRIRVTIVDRHWPEREALTYLAARMGRSQHRVKALIKPR
jgi:hypothetical protein